MIRTTCPICDSDELAPAAEFAAPPDGETPLPHGQGYHRRLLRCGQCGHFCNSHEMDVEALYEGQYNQSTYGERLAKTFDRIISLPREQSDNAGRVENLLAFAERFWGPAEAGKSPTVLDVGSGLGVFGHAMKQAGWDVTALDPDPQSTQHAERRIGVKTICGDFRTVEIPGRYDAVTLNKVIEHVAEPAELLGRAGEIVREDGFVYVEVPDGPAALRDEAGAGRQEFYLEHHHTFSPASLAILAERCGLKLLELRRLRDPSGKYTLRAFLTIWPEAKQP